MKGGFSKIQRIWAVRNALMTNRIECGSFTTDLAAIVARKRSLIENLIKAVVTEHWRFARMRLKREEDWMSF